MPAADQSRWATFTYTLPVGVAWNAAPNADPAQPQPRLCEGPIRIPASSSKFDARPDLDSVNYDYDFGTGKGNLRTLTTYCNDASAATQLMNKLQIVRPGSPDKYIRWTEIEAWSYPQSPGIPASFSNNWEITLAPPTDEKIKIARIKFYLPNKVGWMQSMNLEFDGTVEGSFYPYDGTSEYGPNVGNALPGVEELWKWSAEEVRTYEIAWAEPCGREAHQIRLLAGGAAGKIALATVCGVEIWKKSPVECTDCVCSNGSVDTQSKRCLASTTERCAANGCSTGFTWRNNYPSTGEASCWPRCSQEMPCGGTTGVGGTYWIHKSHRDWYIDANYPGDSAFRSWCCDEGCMLPAAADRQRFLVDGSLFQDQNWGELMTKPGMVAGGAGFTHNSYSCNSGYTGSETASGKTPKFFCEGAGARATFRSSCDKYACICTGGSATSGNLDNCQKQQGQDCAANACNTGFTWRNNHPSTGEASCWPRCSQEMPCGGTTGVGDTYWIHKSHRDWYTDANYPGDSAFRSWCCDEGCRLPAAADRQRFLVDGNLFQDHNWGELMTKPGMVAGGAGFTHNSYSCNTGYTGSETASGKTPKFFCVGAGERATFPNSCDISGYSNCACTNGEVSADLSACKIPNGQNCASCHPEYETKEVGQETVCWKLCSSLSCTSFNVQDDQSPRWYPLRDAKWCGTSTGSCKAACCIAGCSADRPREHGYADHVAYNHALGHADMYPDPTSGFTQLSGNTCDHGWHGAPKFRCRGSGQPLETTGCIDNCRPHVVQGSRTCSSRGYGNATSAADGRSAASGYEPVDYRMQTHERALTNDNDDLTAEECCTRGTQCGGLFMLESQFHTARLENLEAYALESPKGRNFCKTVHKYGEPESVTKMIVPGSGMPEPDTKAMCCKMPTCAEAFFYGGSGKQCPAFTKGFLQGPTARLTNNLCATPNCSPDHADDVVACCKRRRVCPYDEDITEDELGIFSAAIGLKLGKYFNINKAAVLTNEAADGAFSCARFAFDVPQLSTEPRIDFCQGETCSISSDLESDLDVAACCLKYVEHEYMFCNSFQTPRFYGSEEAARQACNYDFPRHACLGYQEDGNVFNSETARLFFNTSLGERVRTALDLETTQANFLEPRSRRPLYGNWSLLLTPKWLDSDCSTAANSHPAECRSSVGELAQCVDLTALAIKATKRRQQLADEGLSPEQAPAPAGTTSPEGFTNVALFDPGNLLTNSTNRASKNRAFLKNRTRIHNSSFTMDDLGVNLSLLFPYSNMGASGKASAKRAGQSSMKTRLMMPEKSVETLKQSGRTLEQAELDAAAGGADEEGQTTPTAATRELSAATMRRAMAAALNSYAQTTEPEDVNEGVTEAEGATTSTASTTAAGPTGASSYTSKSPAAALQNEAQDAETEAAAPTKRGQLLQVGGRDAAEKMGRRGSATSGRTSEDINILDSTTAVSPPFTFVVDIDATSATGEIPATDLAQMLNTSGVAAEVLRKRLAEKILKQQHARGLSSLTLDGISVSIERVSIQRKSALAEDDAAEDGAEETGSDVGATAFVQTNSKDKKLEKHRKTKNNKQRSSYASFCDMMSDAISTLTAPHPFATYLELLMYTLFVFQSLTLLYLCRHNLLGRTRPRGIDLAAAARQKRERKAEGDAGAASEPVAAGGGVKTEVGGNKSKRKKSSKNKAAGMGGSSKFGGESFAFPSSALEGGAFSAKKFGAGPSAFGGGSKSPSAAGGSSAFGGGSSAFGGGSSAFGGGGKSPGAASGGAGLTALGAAAPSTSGKAGSKSSGPPARAAGSPAPGSRDVLSKK